MDWFRALSWALAEGSPETMRFSLSNPWKFSQHFPGTAPGAILHQPVGHQIRGVSKDLSLRKILEVATWLQYGSKLQTRLKHIEFKYIFWSLLIIGPLVILALALLKHYILIDFDTAEYPVASWSVPKVVGINFKCFGRDMKSAPRGRIVFLHMLLQPNSNGRLVDFQMSDFVGLVWNFNLDTIIWKLSNCTGSYLNHHLSR